MSNQRAVERPGQGSMYMPEWMFLRRFLELCPYHVRSLTLSFEQIEMIIGVKLPPEAYRSEETWTDMDGIPRTWGRLPAWRAGPINLREHWVTFTRIGP